MPNETIGEGVKSPPKNEKTDAELRLMSIDELIELACELKRYKARVTLAIKEAKQGGVEVLDLGRSDLDNPGLIAFKRRWGAECSTLNTWRAPKLQSSRRGERLRMRWTKEVFARLPDRLLTLAGRLLYRHIG